MNRSLNLRLDELIIAWEADRDGRLLLSRKDRQDLCDFLSRNLTQGDLLRHAGDAKPEDQHAEN